MKEMATEVAALSSTQQGLKTRAYAAFRPNEPLRPFEIERRALKAHDVLISVSYCGICHSDIHQVRNEWGNSAFPMVPGHEITGIVIKAGASASRFKPGDRVGVGCMVDSCRECNPCLDGFEQYCERGARWTYNSTERDGVTPTYGGYSGLIVVDEAYVLRIPANLPLDAAAPLLCAGITTYSPLREWNVTAGKSVGVIGLGGLGHMAVKFARALKADVTVFSHSPDKNREALRLGANDFILTSDEAAFSRAKPRYDLMINTVSASVDIERYLKLLRMDGTMVLVGVPEKGYSVGPSALIQQRRRLAGSNIGGIAETQEMLYFCGMHNIFSDIQVIKFDRVNDAYEQVLKGDVRYRFVIDCSSLR